MEVGPSTIGGRREPWRAEAPRGAAPSPPRVGWRLNLAVLAGYTAVFAWVFWPLASNMTTKFQGGGDAGSFIWGFWWIRDSLVHLQYPLSTTEIFAPVGTPLAFHTLMPLLGVVTIPLQWLFGPVVTYNMVTASALVLAGYAMFLLARDVGLPTTSAFVAGLSYGFFPPLVDRLAIEHLNLAFTVWLPLSLLALRGALRSDDRWRSAAWLGLTMAGVLYTDLTLTVFVLLLLMAYAVGWAWIRRGDRSGVGRQLAQRTWRGFALFFVLASPYVAVMIRAGRSADGPTVAGLGGAREYSANLASFLVPTSRHRFVGARSEGFYERIQGLPFDGTAYLGATIVVLALVGLIAYRRRRLCWWAFALAVAGVVIALGPVLHVLGRTYVPLAVSAPDGDGMMSLLMPYTWLQGIPLVGGLRSPVRFLTLTGVGLALLAGFGFRAISDGVGRAQHVFMVIGVSALVGFECLAGFMPLVSREVPAVYDVIAHAEGDGVVVDVPLGFRSGLGNVGMQAGPPMVWATYHGRPIATGFGARTAPWRLQALAEMPLYRDILALQSGSPGGDVAEGRESALELRARWVVVNGEYPAVVAYLTDVGYVEIGRDGGVVLFELPKLAPAP
jgi:hypothetical protein